MYISLEEKTGIYCEWLFHYRDVPGREWTLGPYKNKVVQGGIENLAALLIGENPSTTAAMHCVIGSSAVAATLDDDITDMGEVIRKAIAVKTRQGALARLRTQFGPSEGNGDHQCVGVVARSTDQAGSGILLNRLVQPFSKAANTVLTVEVKWLFQGVS